MGARTSRFKEFEQRVAAVAKNIATTPIDMLHPNRHPKLAWMGSAGKTRIVSQASAIFYEAVTDYDRMCSPKWSDANQSQKLEILDEISGQIVDSTFRQDCVENSTNVAS